MKKVVSKGYTLEVVSWENDGDNYRTEFKTFETKEEALYIKDMCLNLFSSQHDKSKGIGNIRDEDYSQAHSIILQYLCNNTDLLYFLFEEDLNKLKPLVEEELKEHITESCTWLDYLSEFLECNGNLVEGWIDIVNDYNYDLLGTSEYYYSRVCESVQVYYSPEDIFLEEIEN